jgi:predicted site-specific integrase-resolvase
MFDLKDPFLKPADIHRIFGIRRKAEIEWRRDGKLPEPIKIGRQVYYRTQDIVKKFNIDLMKGDPSS